MNHTAATMPEKMANCLLPTLTKHTRIGLAGAQRTGKTTLAEHYSKLTGLPFVVSSVSKIMAEIGFDSSATYNTNFKTRLDAQVHLLSRLDEEWSKHTGGFITDRTPMCMAMYTLADIVGTTELSEDDNALLLEYLDHCKLLTMKHFNIVINVKYNPCIELVSKAGSAPAKPHHILHLEALLSHLMFEIDVPTGSDSRNIHDFCSGELENGLHTRLVKPTTEPADPRFGKLENLVKDNLRGSLPSKLTIADLPFSVSTVEQRVQWLYSIVVTEAMNWLADGLTQLRDSPMLDSTTEALYKTIDTHTINYV